MSNRTGQNAAGQGSITLPWLAALLVGIVVGLAGLFGHAPARLLLDHDELASGRLLPLLSAHFVHAGADHLFWNVVPAALVIGIAESARLLSRRRLLLAAAVSIVAVDLWFVSGTGGFARYCGLSGVLVGIYVAVGLAVWLRQGGWLIPVLLAGALLKTLWELFAGASITGALDPAGNWSSAPQAHLAGLLAGSVVALAGAVLRWWAVSVDASRRRGW